MVFIDGSRALSTEQMVTVVASALVAWTRQHPDFTPDHRCFCIIPASWDTMTAAAAEPGAVTVDADGQPTTRPGSAEAVAVGTYQASDDPWWREGWETTKSVATAVAIMALAVGALYAAITFFGL